MGDGKMYGSPGKTSVHGLYTSFSSKKGFYNFLKKCKNIKIPQDKPVLKKAESMPAPVTAPVNTTRLYRTGW
jgi:hypothetical protein